MWEEVLTDILLFTSQHRGTIIITATAAYCIVYNYSIYNSLIARICQY